MKRSLVWSTVSALVVLAFAPNAWAIPAFSRATGAVCSVCHIVFPELTEAGEIFKYNGYRFDSAVGQSWAWGDLENFVTKGAPIAIRSTVYYSMVNDNSLTPAPTDSQPNKRIANSFLPAAATILVAGNVQSHISMWLDHDFGSSDSANEAYARFNGLGTNWTNVKFGSFELDIPFSIAKTHNVFDYLVYDMADASGNLNPFSFGEPQLGVEMEGYSQVFRYSLAAVNGSNNTTDNDSWKSAYGSVFVGPYKARVGAYGYIGTAGIGPNSGGLANSFRTDHHHIWAIDADTHLGHWRWYGLYQFGYDQLGIAANNSLNAFRYNGGFLQGEYNWDRIHTQFGVRYDYVRSNDLVNLGVWSKKYQDAITPQIIALLRMDVAWKTALQFLRAPDGTHVRTFQTGIDWAIY